MHEDSPFLAISHDLLIRLGLDLRISAVNAAATRMLGFAPDALIGRSLADLIHPDDRASATLRLSGADAADIELTTRMAASDHLYRSVALRATRRADELYVAVRERDDTAVLRADLDEARRARRFAEQKSRDYLAQLERSNRELERFASVASHDLQEPLRKIQAFGDRLRDKFQAELAATGRDYLERIRGAARRMQGLINDLLLFSRLTATEKVQARVDLGEVARGVLSDLEVRIEEAGGKVVLGELPTIDADPLHMRQLLQNLVGNALKFARSGVPPVVDISAQLVPAGADPLEQPATCRITVADNGIGIEARYHERIFGIFERLHGRSKYEGTGVGLAVCRKIAEQHHGSIEVKSVFGEGSSFIIVLPMTQLERGPAP